MEGQVYSDVVFKLLNSWGYGSCLRFRVFGWTLQSVLNLRCASMTMKIPCKFQSKDCLRPPPVQILSHPSSCSDPHHNRRSPEVEVTCSFSTSWNTLFISIIRSFNIPPSKCHPVPLTNTILSKIILTPQTLMICFQIREVCTCHWCGSTHIHQGWAEEQHTSPLTELRLHYRSCHHWFWTRWLK